jgi:hypothetical protein
MSKETGGPAFPVPRISEVNINGMTLRDYFAGQAISGCLPGSAYSIAELQVKAQWAYRMADAMLEARK